MTGLAVCMRAYIFAGTVAPISSSALVSCVAIVGDRRRAPEPRVLPLLVEDRVAVVEGVERLRQAERVLREHRQLERPDRLLDDVVEPRRFEDETPEIERFVAVAVQQVAGDAAQRGEDAGLVESARAPSAC